MSKVVYDIDRFIVDLNKYLKKHGISQASFAKTMSFSEAKVSRLFNATRKLHALDFYKIAEFMGVSVDEYVIGGGQMFDVDIRDMSIEEIDKTIEKLRVIRREKIEAAWLKLNEEQERLLRLKAMEE